jgi:hypothetical protein
MNKDVKFGIKPRWYPEEPRGFFRQWRLSGAMSDDSPTVPVNCPVCETTTRVPVSEVAEAVAKHNENQHGGDDVAGVDSAVVDRIAALAAEELGLTDE